jgi:hypothetical protein
LIQCLRFEFPLVGKVEVPFSGDLCESRINAFDTTVIYTSTAVCVLSCNLVLNDYTSGQFTFKCNSGLLTAADTSVTLANGATAVWNVIGTVTTGASSIMNGDLTSDAAITFGAVTTWTGALTTTAGAVDLGVDSSVIGHVTAFGAITLAALANTNPGNLISTNGAVDLGPYSIVRGNIQAAGAITLAALAKVADGSTTGLKLHSTAGAVSLGANAECGDIEASGAITLGANAKSLKDCLYGMTPCTATSALKSINGAITLGAKARSGTINAPNGAVTIGAGAMYTTSANFL